MINQQTIYIAFENHQIAVQSKCPQFLSRVQHLFREMLVVEPSKVIGEFEISQKNGQYHLWGDCEEAEDSGSLDDILWNLKYEIVTCLIRSRPDLLWFHAGAVAYQGKAIIFPAAGGKGKSTLVTSLCAKGWTYLSEDVVPLEFHSGKVIPFPQTPRVRENIGRELPMEKLPELRKTEVDLRSELIARKVMPIGGLIFPAYGFQSSDRLLPCSPSVAAVKLLENCMNFPDHKQVAIHKICNFLTDLSSFCLSFSNSHIATEMIVATYEKFSY